MPIDETEDNEPCEHGKSFWDCEVCVAATEAYIDSERARIAEDFEKEFNDLR